jgi:hypothetical protein
MKRVVHAFFGFIRGQNIFPKNPVIRLLRITFSIGFPLVRRQKRGRWPAKVRPKSWQAKQAEAA